jgi:hypothetical protein
LKVTKSVVDAIIASGLVPHVMIENTRQHRGHSRAWVKTSDLDRFELEHISLAEMAVERDLEPMKLLADLGRRGIRPVVQGGPKVGRFYRRDEIQNLK